jgi:hypothetical protein
VPSDPGENNELIENIHPQTHLAVSSDGGHSVTGVRGRSISGDEGTSISDELGYARAGNRGHAVAGDRGIAITGDGGISIVGVEGVARTGVGGTLVIAGEDENGIRYVVSADVNEETGVKPDTMYRLRRHSLVMVGGFSVADSE